MTLQIIYFLEIIFFYSKHVNFKVKKSNYTQTFYRQNVKSPQVRKNKLLMRNNSVIENVLINTKKISEEKFDPEYK